MTVRVLSEACGAPGAGGLIAAMWCMLLLPAGVAADSSWRPARESRDVALETRVTEAGYRAFRGAVRVCSGLRELQRFVGDASRLDQWIPYTEEVRELTSEGDRALYYLRTSTPWPLKSRDMVYRLEPASGPEDATIRIDITGVPDAVPERRDAVRLTAAAGAWSLTPANGHIHVELRLGVDAGRMPGFLSNRRLAATVGGTLANLAAQFPCR